MVHQFQRGGYNIVVDVCSGAIHVVDEAAYDMIALYKEKPREEAVSLLLEKYRDRPELTRRELEECWEAIGERSEERRVGKEC